MFRKMRRNKQELSFQDTLAILQNATSGTLALSGDAGYPYAVPINYVLDAENMRIYYHCAMQGHKIDAVKRNEKASFAVIGYEKTVPEKLTSYYKSCIVFGKIRIVTEKNEKYRAAQLLAKRFAPETEESFRNEEIEGAFDWLCILSLNIEHITGKAAKELVTAAH